MSETRPVLPGPENDEELEGRRSPFEAALGVLETMILEVSGAAKTGPIKLLRTILLAAGQGAAIGWFLTTGDALTAFLGVAISRIVDRMLSEDDPTESGDDPTKED